MKALIVYTISWVVIMVILWLLFTAKVQANGPDADFREGGSSITYGQIMDMGYSVVGYPGELIIAPGEFGERFLPIAWCESRYDPNAVGALLEKGSLQIHPIHREGMANAGLDFEVEADRLRWAINLYRVYKWRPWSCAR